jgi:hypothetical protein
MGALALRARAHAPILPTSAGTSTSSESAATAASARIGTSISPAPTVPIASIATLCTFL